MSTGIYVSVQDAIDGAEPHWNDLGPRPWVHEWRSHIPMQVQAIWGTFTREQREALVAWAEKLSDNEDWE